MKVFALLGTVQFEGSFLLDIFETLDAAEDEKNRLMAIDNQHGVSYYDYYVITEKELKG